MWLVPLDLIDHLHVLLLIYTGFKILLFKLPITLLLVCTLVDLTGKSTLPFTVDFKLNFPECNTLHNNYVAFTYIHLNIIHVYFPVKSEVLYIYTPWKCSCLPRYSQKCSSFCYTKKIILRSCILLSTRVHL